MFYEWVIATLLRPGTTFELAKRHLRFGYWWILLSEFTLEIIIALYSPIGQVQFAGHRDLLVLVMLFQLFLVLDIQALFLMGAARAFGWRLSWTDALKYIGLTWSVELVESVVLFYPGIKGQLPLIFWTSLFFLLWFNLVLFAGVRRLTGFPSWKAALLTAMAVLPWEGFAVWQNWSVISAG